MTYDFELSQDSSFATEVFTTNVASPTFRPASDLDVSLVAPVGARYYWRVRSCDGADCSEWSSTWSIHLGQSFADFNGDGYADVLVGSWLTPSGGTGWVHLQGPSPLAKAYQAGSREEGLASLGDVNGDGFADFAIGHRKSAPDVGYATAIYFGGAVLPMTAVATLDGSANVRRVGDVDRDGFDDVWINGSIYRGGPGSSLDTTIDEADATWGKGVCDVNGDGFLDSPTSLGGDVGPMVAAPVGVLDCADVNGDGFSDLLSSPFDGEVHVYFGNAVATFGDPDATITAPTGDRFGNTIVGVGDTNGDGFEDFLVGAPEKCPADNVVSCESVMAHGGEAYLFLGGSVVSTTAALIHTMCGRNCGWSAGSPGDIDGDGRSDYVIGAPGYEAGGDGKVWLSTDDSGTPITGVGFFFGMSVVQGGRPIYETI